MEPFSPEILQKVRTPNTNEKVYKDECAYCFDTPECPDGLYICMNTFLGLGKSQVERHYRKTGSALYLHHRRIVTELPVVEDGSPKQKPTHLGIGVDGGFDLDSKKFDVQEQNTLVQLPSWTEYALDEPSIPFQVQMSAAGIVAAPSVAKQEELAAANASWDGEKRVISKYAENLEQLDNGRKIPPSGWKCDKCEMKENLWLNLTDGAILCGRKFWDGTGGNDHAVNHYAETKHPLAVKLGTITAEGGDVFSYDEDDMVEDPHLAKHLAHFGIDVMSMQKTDKTMAELEIDLNQRVGEWDVIQEAGSQLEPLHGPGFTGIRNLGNSCYMNSIMQVMFTLPDFVHKYFTPCQDIFQNAPNDPTSDFNVQMAKFAHGLLSGDYSKESPKVATEIKEPTVRVRAFNAKIPPPHYFSLQYPEGIRPQMFKALIGQGHPEFSSKRQQDAQEFLLHLISMIQRNCHGSSNPADCLRFKVEDRIECMASGKVAYTERDDFLLALQIPVEKVTNPEEVAAWEAKKADLEQQKKFVDPKDIVRPRISLTSCLEAFTAPEVINDFYSTAIQGQTTAKKSTKLASFPDYLFVQMKKFTLGPDWIPKKLDVSLDMPDALDLSQLRGNGRQPGEEQLPEAPTEKPVETVEAVNIDDSLVQQVSEMGFPFEACKKAVYHTKNAGLEAAMQWVMEHMDDPDFAVPLQLPGQSQNKAPAFVPNDEGVTMLVSMGFRPAFAVKALQATDNNLERAADWIFSHTDDGADDPEPMETSAAASAAAPACNPGRKFQVSSCGDGESHGNLHHGRSLRVPH
ncbi:hypothetical protein CAPTEDRAFT_182887 [Capitella teleta]|uniref:Ubiquitin carboxyl-terminal hydrolase n=1 Tax=Capitella teleta TaxID=283909 RepID=R7TKT7_CAPTE|nr:hypothetical protein CAPTEDRAFT_182887 [Capitella teleta]|eukprot:ELT92166.1 hypothetical protein CAPTEDRAFT_182887 [Capitella teleta]